MDIRRKSLLYLILLALIWGGTYMLIRLADRTMTPLTFTMGRTIIGTIVLYVYLRSQGQVLPPIGRAWIPFGIMGIFAMLAPVLLIAYGEESVSGGFAAVLLSTVPIITVVLAHFTISEHLSTEKLIGVILGLAGATIVVLPDLLGGIELGLMGVILLLIVAVLRAGTTVYARADLAGVTPLVLTTGMSIVATVVSIPLSFALENPLALRPSAESLLAMVASGVFCSAIAYNMFYWLVANRGATYASLVSAIRPVVAVLFSVVFMGTAMRWTTLAGMVVLVFCIAVMNGYFGHGREFGRGAHKA